ncbi:MAG: hypothetical protein GC137_10105 [Alphaproteobacteria bacterium]|nr:hypothetical protein [Alphaproteobacteria bacterium]
MLKRFFLFYLFVTAIASEAYAGPHAGEKAPDGLPQLDFATYPSQIFWLIITFSIVYVIYSQKAVPDLSGIIKNRTERIKNDLDTAEELKDEVAAVQKAYEESLHSAREKSVAHFRAAENEVAKKTEQQTQDFQKRSSEKVIELEKSIQEAKKNAMEDMSDIAAEIAILAAEKIIGVKTDQKSVRAVIDSLNKKAA